MPNQKSLFLVLKSKLNQLSEEPNYQFQMTDY